LALKFTSVLFELHKNLLLNLELFGGLEKDLLNDVGEMLPKI
jgi:hypothetical protein